MTLPTENIVDVPVSHPRDRNREWDVITGASTIKLLDKQFKDNNDAIDKTREASIDILKKCINPNQEECSNTGLVVGYVQSGKTLSFTTVTTLANDNNYDLIIVIAGISNKLLNQTYGRLVGDLDANDAFGDWDTYKEPKSNESSNFEHTLDWTRKSCQDRKQEDKKILVVIKKHHVAIKNLTKLLKNLKPKRKIRSTYINH